MIRLEGSDVDEFESPPSRIQLPYQEEDEWFWCGPVRGHYYDYFNKSWRVCQSSKSSANTACGQPDSKSPDLSSDQLRDSVPPNEEQLNTDRGDNPKSKRALSSSSTKKHPSRTHPYHSNDIDNARPAQVIPGDKTPAEQDVEGYDAEEAESSDTSENPYATQYSMHMMLGAAEPATPFQDQNQWQTFSYKRRKNIATKVIHDTAKLAREDRRVYKSIKDTQAIDMDEIPRQPAIYYQKLLQDSGEKWIVLMRADTIVAAKIFDEFRRRSQIRGENTDKKIGILNLADGRYPGGSFTNGKNYQEESLCARTTLYATLKPSYYEGMAPTCIIYSPDVLVFSLEAPMELDYDAQFHVDVLSCAAIYRPPLLEINGIPIYAKADQEELMKDKIADILRLAVLKGVKWLVLAPLGCGAYNNPIYTVAWLFRQALLQDETTGSFRAQGLEKVFIAIDPNLYDDEVWYAFRRAFASSSQVEIDFGDSILEESVFSDIV